MRGPKTTDDLKALDKALSPLQQGLDYVPPDIEAALKDYQLDELHELLRKGCVLTSVIMAQKGWLLTMIKRKVGHGNFKDHLREIGFDYSYAAKCMKVAYAIGRHPALAQIGDTNLLRKIVYLPDSKQEQIEVKITRVNAVDKKKETHTDLSPWLLELIAADLKNEKPKKKRKKEVAVVIPDFDQELNDLFVAAHKALLDLADYAIAIKHKAQALKAVRALSADWERASYNLSDPEHKKTPRWEMDPHERALDGIDEEEGATLS